MQRFEGQIDNIKVFAIITDLSEFINSEPDSIIFVSDSDGVNFSVEKRDVDWTYVEC